MIKLEIQKNGCNLYKQKWEMRSKILSAKTLDELNFEIKFEMLDFRQQHPKSILDISQFA